jgi:Ala-tRNA(Pro) deacylase
MPNERLESFLKKEGVTYACEQHPDTVTAQYTAEVTHTKGKEMAKSVVMSLDGKPALFVLPAPMIVDEDSVMEMTGASALEMADEGTLTDLFPDCETGAMPPFGNLYGLDVYVDENLAEDDTIAFTAGTHHEIVRLAYDEFERLVEPTIGDFAKRPNS